MRFFLLFNKNGECNLIGLRCAQIHITGKYRADKQKPFCINRQSKRRTLLHSSVCTPYTNHTNIQFPT